MTDYNKHIKSYTAKDFERYYAGKMTAMEMHELERSALDDPFLQDALEGFQSTHQGVTDVEALKQRVNQRIEKTEVVSFGRHQSPITFWKVAAMVLLTAGMGWLVYNVVFDNEPKNIAVMEKPSENLPVASDSAPDTLSGSGEIKATDELNSATANSVSPMVNNKKVVLDQRKATQQGSENNSARVKKNPSLSRQVQPDILHQEEAVTPNVAIQRQDTSQMVGYGNGKKVQPGTANNVELDKATDSIMEEVVVAKTAGSANYRKHQINFEEAIPKNGKLYYNEYVEQNIQTPLIEKMKSPAGEVKLSFDVNPKGQAVNIKVEKSLCKPCDEEAVRLLKEGPGWIQKKKSKKGKFSIRF